MFCLRSWLPLLFIPTNASPIFILLFFICTYFLNRPCVYCSFLLLILFASSCHWSDHCFFDFSSPTGFFLSPPSPSSSYLGAPSATIAASSADLSAASGNDTAVSSLLGDGMLYLSALNGTVAKALADAALQGAKGRIPLISRPEWTGIGVGWLRSLLGRREWRLPCVDVYVRL